MPAPPPPPPPPRRDFPAFPFAPYPIQSEFMSFLYGALSSGPGALALLESPTGTGKTLSIICSALQWLGDHRDAAARGSTTAAAAGGGGEGDGDEPDWMRDFTPLPPEKPTAKKGRPPAAAARSKAPRRAAAGSEKPEGSEEAEDEEFLVEEYESDGEVCVRREAGKRPHRGGGSSSESEADGEEEEEEEVTPKVFFTSRTHSQLSQFVGELKKTEFGWRLRTVCLGSRKNLCINKDVLKLGSANRINERCLELQKSKKSSKTKVEGDNRKVCQSKTSCGCPMIRKRGLQKEFKSEVSEQGALDIEDLAQLGKKIGTCPYYGARDMVRTADLVVLPYQSLLLKSARESLGLNLKNSVVIIDEAHNLADSLTSMYNSKITSSQLNAILSHLEAYLNRFQSVLGAGNRRYIQTLTVLTRSFLRVLTSNQDDACTMTSMTINQFLFSLDIDNINIVKLCQYVKESNIIHKITCDAYAVILAGGTLQPIEETRLRLFPNLPPSDIKFFTCNHIVPPESILPIAVTRGPSGKAFDFSYSSRSSHTMIEELGRFLCNVVTTVPEGVVMFFASYEYERFVYDAWAASGMISKISKKKHVFREPKNSVDVEMTLNKYKEAIQSCSKSSQDTGVTGALLLAVVGGKISEGINFSDGMGRCVVMVGLPYPSPSDVELTETIKYIENISKPVLVGGDNSSSSKYDDECKLQPGFDILRKCNKGGREYYENLCMKAVNQSIGRAIRHANDYAAMLLVDSRYAHTSSNRSSSSPTDKLPQWIKTRLACAQNYGEDSGGSSFTY
uniref:Helicase ATP-binding domain-containing protein n=1 Tax=Oryza rufipogon TaxID=4529 RepID=A0A0E0PJ32_ORYRU